MSRCVRLDVPLPADALFDYLSDPQRRPDWQASLRAVADVQGAGELGTTWTDCTAVGARPRLRVTGYERPRVWIERGTWQGVAAVLRLDLLPYGVDRTRLTATYAITGSGLFALPAAVLERLAGPAIAADLRRAVRLAAPTPGGSNLTWGSSRTQR